MLRCIFREHSIVVYPVLSMGDIATFDILILEMADLIDAQAGRIHEGDHGLLLDVRHCIDIMKCILLGRHKGKAGVKLAHRKQGIVPWFMDDIDGEKVQL